MRILRFMLGCVLLALSFSARLAAGQPLAPAHQRFATERTDEAPDFQRHVVPLLGRLGCNGRACHGSFAGQGGFRLSLFGYDFSADHESLAGGPEPRVDLGQPAASLILQKPTLAIDHEGGQRFRTGEWEYHLLRRWIEAGAPGNRQADVHLQALHVEPREIIFAAAGQSNRLTVVVEWSDGTREDVTPLSRFRTNDESVATVSESGLVTSAGPGDSHVVAFYDNGIVPVPVILPVSSRNGPPNADGPPPTRIDELVEQKLRTVGIVPSGNCTDAEFLRRVSLDLTGTPPAPDEITAFLADPSLDKRGKKIDELQSQPSYAAWWTTRLCDYLGNAEQNLPIGGEQGLRREKSVQWYEWIYRRVRDNVPYDEIVEGIVLARSREPDQSNEEYFREMGSYFREKDPADFTARRTMPYFWTRGRFSPPQPLRFSYAFLGIRLECAQCHKHPYDQWTKADYDGFGAFFEGVGFRYPGKSADIQQMKVSLDLLADPDSAAYRNRFAKLAREGTTLYWAEVTVPSPQKQIERVRRQAKISGGRVFTPRLLGGEEVLATDYEDPREPVMEWLRQPDNPYFARSIVNRVWGNYFGVGIIEPTDDLNLANPPSNEPLLEDLAKQFVASGYDLAGLHRRITNSRTYQRSWRPNETNERDERNFSRALVRRLPAEVVYDALRHATASDDVLRAMHHNPTTVRDRAIGVASPSRSSEQSYVLNLFGKPAREGICDCHRSSEPSLLQTIFLRNDHETFAMIDRKDGWMRQAAGEQNTLAAHPDRFVRQAYLRTFGRPPIEDEMTTALEHVRGAANPLEGLRDLFWALLNSKEFVLNH